MTIIEAKMASIAARAERIKEIEKRIQEHAARIDATLAAIGRLCR